MFISANTSGRQIYEAARQASSTEAVRALTGFITCLDGYLAASGFALVPTQADALPILSLKGQPLAANYQNAVSDPAMLALGVQLVEVQGSLNEQPNALVELGALYLRLGLLGQNLDMVYRHLEPRSSFGQKVLKHQLVRATFAEANGLMKQMLEECDLIFKSRGIILQAYGLGACLALHHQTVSRLSASLCKLMGGHGYLLDGNAPLHHVAALVAKVFTSKPVAVASDGVAPTTTIHLDTNRVSGGVA